MYLDICQCKNHSPNLCHPARLVHVGFRSVNCHTPIRHEFQFGRE